MKFSMAVILMLSCVLFSEGSTDSLNNEKKKKGFVLLPVIFFSPETSLGFGAAGMAYFRTDQDSSQNRPSNFQSVFIYTLENQILFTNPYNLFLDQGNYWLRGEIGLYVYPYQYYGIGPDVSIADENAEFYDADYLRFESNFLRKIRNDFYIGPTFFLDQYFKIDTEETGRLQSENVLGIKPGRLFGYGVSFTLDRRNNVFCPYSGYYLEGRFLRYENRVLGDFAFTDTYVDIRKYFYPNDTWETGVQLYHQSIIGEPPFYNYALLGGGKLMRGYYQGAYRDHHQTVLQGEVRRYIANRVVLAAFGGIGSVTEKFASYEKLLGSYGVGLRYEINNVEHIRIRIDYARGYHTDGFYININEAF